MIRNALIAGGMVVLTGPALALTPPLPACWIEAGEPESEFAQYEPEHLGNGFVAFETIVDVQSDPDLVLVVEYCPEAWQLVVTVPDYNRRPTLAASVEEMFDTMIYGTASYTMNQMSDALSGLGAETRLRTVEYKSCACAAFGE